ncbi:DgyrCDS10299 [Dimorphilus gyrociliatus]|uniref:DgyrCDS10299 n=1 Tax=Dimorphilus gyrociliatus TaxID=2664684 RepID=A0A7I8W0Y3_9ANNE|nr:DgyrCDS10299 [Dimorphilus gyrociliatus]
MLNPSSTISLKKKQSLPLIIAHIKRVVEESLKLPLYPPFYISHTRFYTAGGLGFPFVRYTIIYHIVFGVFDRGITVYKKDNMTKNMFSESRNLDSGIHSLSESGVFFSKDTSSISGSVCLTEEEGKDQEMKAEMLRHLMPFRTAEEKTSFLFRPNTDGDTKLHLALIHGYPSLCLDIIEYAKSDLVLNHRNNEGITALHLAVYQNFPKVIRKLIIRGADQSITDHNGNTPLHICCKKGSAECVTELIKPLSSWNRKGGLLDQNRVNLCKIAGIRNFNGLTCLHEAVLEGNFEIIKTLLEYDEFQSIINNPDCKSGRTILHFAVESSSKTFNKHILTYILSRGNSVDLDAITFSGYSPIDIASGLNNTEAVKILEEYRDEGFENVEENFHNLKV